LAANNFTYSFTFIVVVLIFIVYCRFGSVVERWAVIVDAITVAVVIV
jgi:hypothetical protein